MNEIDAFFKGRKYRRTETVKLGGIDSGMSRSYGGPIPSKLFRNLFLGLVLACVGVVIAMFFL